MCNKSGVRFLGGLLAVLVCGAFGAATAMAQTPRPSVKLSAAPTASTFSIGQPATLRIQLTNTGPSAIGLSDLTDANMVIVSFQRNGVNVSPRKTSADFDDDLTFVLGGSLKSVAPNASISTTWSSYIDNATQGQAFRAVTFDGSAASEHTAQIYGIDSSGTYSLTFYYQYPAPPVGFVGTVFTGRTNTVTVSFNVF